VTVAGGSDRVFKLGDYSGVASGTRVFCSSNDYVNDLVTIAPPGIDPSLLRAVNGDVIFERYTGIGANAIVMPNNRIPEGTVIGALSFVPANFQFEPWSVYFGNPIRYIMPRNKESVLAQAEAFRKSRGAS
jgi:acetyltransferase-like isoleucine patch superfamily enzyme